MKTYLTNKLVSVCIPDFSGHAWSSESSVGKDAGVESDQNECHQLHQTNNATNLSTNGITKCSTSQAR